MTPSSKHLPMGGMLASALLGAAMFASQAFAAGPTTVTGTQNGPATVGIGQNLVYTVTVKNTGTAAAQNFKLVETVDASLTFHPQATTPGCVQTGVVSNPNGRFYKVIQCAPIVLPALQSRTYQFSFDLAQTRVNCNQPLESFAYFFANNVASTSTNVLDTTPTGCQPWTPPVPSDPIATVTATESAPATATVGQTITYTVQASNVGTVNANHFVMRETVDPSLSFIPSQSTPGCVDMGVVNNGGTYYRQINCSPIALPALQSRTYTFVFRVRADLIACGQTLVGGAYFDGTNVAGTGVSPVATTATCQ